MNKPSLSVIIPTYNRASLLRKCLESFERQEIPKEKFEVIVVDDGSSDETQSILNQHYPFALRPIFAEHGGAAKARNRGIGEAQGDIIVFTDDDCFPEPNFLRLHWEAHQKKNNLIVRGPVVIIRSIDVIPQLHQKAAALSMNFFCTSNASLYKENLLKVGFFDESFKRWEDAELGYRLRKSGLQYHFNPKIIVLHLKPYWKLKDLIRTARADGRSARQLYNRHPGLRTWFSSGLHPLNRAIGKLLLPFAKRKADSMSHDDQINGVWEHLIFQAYFSEGLLSQK